MRRLIAAILLIGCSLAAWATEYHLCPDTDAFNVDLNYGDEDGSSEANCYDGFSDAATTNVVAPGDTVVLHGTFYNERGYAWTSGTSGSPITFVCGDDCLFWFSLSVSGNYTSNNSAPHGQTTGSSWQLVEGTTDVWKKGVGAGPYMMWVNGVRVPNTSAVPATEDDAGAIAVLTGVNQFTVATPNLDGFSNTLYFRGALTDDMRVNNQSVYTVPYSAGGFYISGKDYIAIEGLNMRGYRVNVTEIGGLFVQNCTGCSVTGIRAWENGTGVKLGANTDFVMRGTTASPCTIEDNILIGVSLSGQELLTNSYSPLLITAISNVSGTTPGGQIDTAAAHGLATGEKIIIRRATGLTALNDVEKTATVVDSDSFTIATDTSAMGSYTANTGIIYVQRTDTDTQVRNCLIEDNAPYARYNGIDINWSADSDGMGVGYFGGTVDNLSVIGNRFYRNGPRRPLISGELGNTNRGSGLLLSTSYTMFVNNLRVAGNDFEGNHRYNLAITDTNSALVAGNLFRGVVNYDAAAADNGQVSVRPASAGANPLTVANNVFTGESGSYGLVVWPTEVGNIWKIHNNVFSGVTKSTLASPWDGALHVPSITEAIQESHNKFLSIESGILYKRVSTQYSSVATWAAATGQGDDDEVIANAGWIGGDSPTAAAGFRLLPSSALVNAGVCYRSVGCAHGDYRGRTRGSDPDIGAYEQAAGSWAAPRSAATVRQAATPRASSTIRNAR